MSTTDTTGFTELNRLKRPTRLGSVKQLNEALKWRSQLVSEFKNKNTRMFDPTLNDEQLQELNDELNELIKEKKRWDYHITKKLAHGRKHDDRFFISGKLVLGKHYFGRANELPEVKDYIKEHERKKLQGADPRKLIDVKRIPLRSTKSNQNIQQDSKSASIYYGTGQDLETLKNFETHWAPIVRELYKAELTPIQTPETDSLDQLSKQEVPTQSMMETWLVEQRKQKLLSQLNL